MSVHLAHLSNMSLSDCERTLQIHKKMPSQSTLFSSPPSVRELLTVELLAQLLPMCFRGPVPGVLSLSIALQLLPARELALKMIRRLHLSEVSSLLRSV